MRLDSKLALTLTLLLAALPAATIGASWAGHAGAQSPAAASIDLVRAEYSGERARDVVAFVDQYWRVPGNRGFNASIAHVVEVLEGAGYVAEEEAEAGSPLTYRIERRPMERLTWDPVDASLSVVGGDTLLEYASNRNMLAVNSFSTPATGIEAEVVYAAEGEPEQLDALDVAGKIVLADGNVSRLFRDAVQERGAAGVLSYSMPSYTRPQQNRDSIQFGTIPLDPERSGWGLRLSFAAREKLLAALASGPVRARVNISAELYESDELTLVAEVRGRRRPSERFVFSAHVQEPGANDNASGVGALAEAARVLGALTRSGSFTAQRTITMLWGDEIRSTRRYLQEDADRTAGVLWGMSLDMVGEDTAKTGGTFLIEKMPDPSAVWTRGEDSHTEWGGRPLGVDELTPHYFNDFVLARCREQAALTGWVVKTNPFEGGSDHVPFLSAGKPGLLLWHFTDQFYHTDGDRLGMVSAATLANVGTCALTSAMTLANADGAAARAIVAEIEAAALERLQAELALGRAALESDGDAGLQETILRTWTSWYVEALRSARDIEVGGASTRTSEAIEEAAARVTAAGEARVRELRGGG